MFSRQVFSSLVLASVLLCFSHNLPVAGSNAPVSRKVLASYYTWYGTPAFQGRWIHWNEGGRNPDTHDSKGWPDIGATHHPLRLYDSNDPTIIREHLKLASDSGIDALVSLSLIHI